MEKRRAYDATLAILPLFLTDMPPAGLTAVSTYLRHKGYEVRTLDLNIEVFNRISAAKRRLWHRENYMIWTVPDQFRRIEPILASEVDYCVERLLDEPSDVLGLSVVHPNRNFTRAVLLKVRAADPDRVIVIGGRGWEREPERRVFRNGIPDAFAEGEGQQTMVEVVEAVRSGRPLHEIPGVLAWKDGDYTSGKDRDVLPCEEAFPLQTFEEYDLSLYENVMLPITFSQGCICRCAYCNDKPMSGPFRWRSAASLAEQLEWCVRELGVSRFLFTDSAVNGNLRELVRFAQLIVQKGLEVSWVASAIPRPDMSFDQLKTLARSGCRCLTFGIESGSDRVLTAMRRRWSAQQQAEAVKRTFEAGIKTQLNFIVGFPGETEEDFEATIEWISRNRPWISEISNLNACQVLYPAALRTEHESFGVVIPSDTLTTDDHWTDKFGMDRKKRLERLDRLMGLVESLGIACWTSNERRQEMSAEEIEQLQALKG